MIKPSYDLQLKNILSDLDLLMPIIRASTMSLYGAMEMGLLTCYAYKIIMLVHSVSISCKAAGSICHINQLSLILYAHVVLVLRNILIYNAKTGLQMSGSVAQCDIRHK